MCPGGLTLLHSQVPIDVTGWRRWLHRQAQHVDNNRAFIYFATVPPQADDDVCHLGHAKWYRFHESDPIYSKPCRARVLPTRTFDYPQHRTHPIPTCGPNRHSVLPPAG